MKPFTPIQINTDEPVEEVKYVPFFYIDDVEYTIPEKVPARVVATYLRDVRSQGDDRALANALIELCGEEAWDALIDAEHVGDREMQQIMGVLSELLMGGMKKAMGKSRNAQRRSRG